MEEADAYVTLLKEGDGGESFLKIMRNFEATFQKESMYLNTLQSLDVPMQIIWGENDKGLTLQKYGKPLQNKLNLDHIIKLPGAHFLQEDYSDEVVKNVADMINNSSEIS